MHTKSVHFSWPTLCIAKKLSGLGFRGSFIEFWCFYAFLDFYNRNRFIGGCVDC